MFTGICTVIYLPIKLIANSAQTPCKATKKSAVKNLLDLKYVIKIMTRYMAKTKPRKSLAESILFLLKNYWTYYFYYFDA